jgi:hypothetical protein
MTHRDMPIIALSCRINRLEFASAVCAGSNRNGRRSDF